MNSDTAQTVTETLNERALAKTGDPSLTLAARKLAGSVNCLNCGTVLMGPFCYHCGQPDRNFLRFFPALLRDLLEDLLDLDSRFLRTIKPLLFKPGRLTRDYMDGRRFRYVPPMRLYIFSSLVFFLMAALISSNAILTNAGEDSRSLIVIDRDSDQQQQEVEDAINELPADVRQKIDLQKTLSEQDQEEDDGKLFEPGQINLNGEPWDRETNPVDIGWLPDWINDRINDEIEGSPQKAEQINNNPNLVVDKVFDILPATMFVLLPVVALIFKFWYLFAKRYYLEHLIFSLHNHSFIFICLLLMLLADTMSDVLEARGMASAVEITNWLMIVFSVWMPVYLLLSLRVVFQQGWLLTTGKFILIGISYLALLIIVTTVVAIASFVLL